MKNKCAVKLIRFAGLFLLLSTINYRPLTFAQGTAFTYQGRLGDNGQSANGTYDLQFTIYNSTNLPGTVVAGPLTNSATSVSNGLFTVALDFGASVFTGADRWLEIGVRTNGAVAFTPISPRQNITPAPYAIFAAGASNVLGIVPAGGLSGSYSGPVSFNNPADTFSGSHSGNGSGLTNVNALTLGGVGANGFWRTAGNAGTVPGANFIGTTDNQPLEIQVNATRALRIEPHGISAPSLVGGYFQNTVAGFSGAVVAGGGTSGGSNAASGDFAFVGAGYGNSAGINSATVSGAFNSAPSYASFIGSGAINTNGGDYSFLGGGVLNSIGTNSPYSTVGGGYNNSIQTNSLESIIVGGHDNIIRSANFAVIGGGGLNTIQSGAFDSTIAGGGYGLIGTNAHSSFIGGGGSDVIGTNAVYSSVVGGQYNNNGASYSVIAGGLYNSIGPVADSSAIAGGYANTIQSNSINNFIGGGAGNLIGTNSGYSSIVGGANNIVSNSGSAIIAGGHDSAIQSANFAFIGGGGLHVIQSGAFDSAIAGGGYGTIGTDSHSAFIGGGGFNTIQTNAPYSTIGGGYVNTIQFNSAYSTIAGGWVNTIQTNALYSFIGGGVGNTIQTNSSLSIISGGYANVVQSNTYYGTILGGYGNTVAGGYGFAAGVQAQALHFGSFVWADAQFTPFASTTNNQFNVRAQGGVRFVTGGAGLTVDGQPALISGNGISIQQNTNGSPNVIEGSPFNFVGGGVVGATIGGGGATNYLGSPRTNSVSSDFGVIAGGGGNTILSGGESATIGGGSNNKIEDSAAYSTIAGGNLNLIQSGATASAIGGGSQNVVQSNTIYGVIAGGIFNTNNSLGATVGGGGNNNVTGSYSTLAGGYQNSATGQFGVLSGGYQNKSAGSRSTVPGGYLNVASGDFSFAAGQQAQALHQGAFVWADSQNAAFASTISNQFNVRAGNGLRVSEGGTNGNVVIQPLAAAGAGYQAINFNGYYDQTTSTEQRFNSNKARWRLVVDQRSAADNMSIDTYTGSSVLTAVTILTNGNVGIGIPNPLAMLDMKGTARIQGSNNWDVTSTEGDFRVGTGSFRFKIGVATSGGGAGDVWMRAHGGTGRIFMKTPGGTTIYSNDAESSGVSLAANGTAWAVVSDRNAKKDFAPIDSREILDKLAAMPITQWHYKWEEESVTPHIGPMAQDFKVAFYPGTDDKSITTQEADGVALAAIQGLNQKLEVGSQRSEDRIQKLETENAELKARLEKIERLMESKYADAR
jgi:hypothetical protein